MKKFLIFIVVLIVLIGGAAVALPHFVSMDKIEAQAKEKFKEATGRDLAYSNMRFTVWPNLGLRLTDVAISNPAWAKSKSMLTLGEMDVSLAVMPLLEKKVEVKTFTLKKPVIALETTAEGKNSWTFEGAAGKAGDAPAKSQGGAGGGMPADFAIKLGTFKISDGQVSYRDGATGKTETVEDIDMDINMPTLQSPLDLDGGMMLRGARVNIVLGLDKPMVLAQGGTSNGSLNVKTPHLTAAVKGAFAAAGTMLKGDVDVQISSLADLIAWATQEKAGDLPFKAVSFKSAAEATGQSIKITGATLGLDDINAKGDVSVNVAGKKPVIYARLSLDKIDLDRFLPQDSAQASGSGAPAPKTAQAGWDETPIDFSGLKAADADVVLQTGGFSIKGVDVGASTLTAKLADANLQFSSSEATLFGGKFSSSLGLNAASATPTQSFRFDMDGVDAKPVLSTFANFDKLSGKALANVSVTSAGKSQKDIISALNGSGKVTFSNGALEGIDLVNIAKMVQSKLTQMEIGAGKTDFVDLGGTFTIVKGVAHNEDLKMRGPLLQASGLGDIDLPVKFIKYRVTPVLTASSAVEGASGIAVPVDIKGPFNNIKIKPDYGAVLKNALENPEEMKKTLKQAEDSIEPVKDNIKTLKKDFKDNPEKAIGDLLQGGGLGGLLKKKEAAPTPAPVLEVAPAPAPEALPEATQPEAVPTP